MPFAHVDKDVPVAQPKLTICVSRRATAFTRVLNSGKSSIDALRRDRKARVSSINVGSAEMTGCKSVGGMIVERNMTSVVRSVMTESGFR